MSSIRKLALGSLVRVVACLVVCLTISSSARLQGSACRVVVGKELITTAAPLRHAMLAAQHVSVSYLAVGEFRSQPLDRHAEQFRGIFSFLKYSNIDRGLLSDHGMQLEIMVNSGICLSPRPLLGTLCLDVRSDFSASLETNNQRRK